jgi:hypothetical protein
MAHKSCNDCAINCLVKDRNLYLLLPILKAVLAFFSSPVIHFHLSSPKDKPLSPIDQDAKNNCLTLQRFVSFLETQVIFEQMQHSSHNLCDDVVLCGVGAFILCYIVVLQSLTE